MEIFYLKDESELEQLAMNVASLLKKKKSNIIALVGQLGAGKTTFTKYLAKQLGVKETIKSPTFNLIREYDINFNNFKKLYHIDCYRLEKPKKFFDEHIKELISKENLIIIEWADKLNRYLRKEDLITIKFFVLSESKRKVVLL